MRQFYDEMHARLQTAKAKRLKKLRSSTVEPVLGTLINFMGLRRIWTRGIEGATKMMLGAAFAYNLKKWMKYELKNFKVPGMLKKKAQNLSKMQGNEPCFSFCYTGDAMEPVISKSITDTKDADFKRKLDF